ncbi:MULTISPECIES: DUF1330 domain-containing protein [Paraburkholderia]|uniref:DUF1330 domain-containing protein n=1 Tax=Paraburkholderia pallida TaxID=2547399 RepID=A0A4P7CUV7_9BURK|nr:MULTISPECIES: DUF1330 domain-containing protein [Paraburkholderia]QBQ99067.1 DUF1330 domain-containing protein [Paraburkholderia pallida]
MPKAYWTCAYRLVPDHRQREVYSELATAAVKAGGGRFLVRGGRMRANEDAVVERTVIVEFDSYDQAIAAYDSELYAKALAALPPGTLRDHRIVEALE